jgi:hypothetical protein
MNGAKGYLSDITPPGISEKNSQIARISLARNDKIYMSKLPIIGIFATTKAIGIRITKIADRGESGGFEISAVSDISPNTSHITTHINILQINVRRKERISFLKKLLQ